MTLFDTEKFIAQIKKRPAIYDVNCLQYNDRGAKNAAWREVCEAMNEDWDGLSEEDKTTEEKNIRNKWRNIRDYFMKEVKMVRKGKPAGRGGGRKRKKYSYYSQLLFLIPSVKKRGSKNKKSSQPCKNEILITDEIEVLSAPAVEEQYSLQGISLQSNGSAADPYQHQTVGCEATLGSFDTEMAVDVLAANGQANQRTDFTAEDDYDKMFLLSLLPSLRQIPEHMKLHVRIQMQQILASAFHPSNHHAG